jgi:hypothetical protein
MYNAAEICMRVYAYDPSFTLGEGITLCVEPNQRFSLTLYYQDSAAALVKVTSWSLKATSNVTNLGRSSAGRLILQSGASSNPMRFDQDWQWPSLTISISRDNYRSNCYVAVVFTVDANGNPTDAIGTKVINGQSIYPQPPDSDSMALVVGRPYMPANANIAYIVPTGTYHAYNWTGGGCFYDNKYQGTTGTDLVTMRRPGGGLGAQLGEPADPYDTTSPRQQFAHWDAKFIRWMKSNSISCDFYCDLDLHTGISMNLYQLVLSVGHHEYWSGDMRNNLAAILRGGANYASFSGNTCFRPVDFGAYRTSGFMNSVHKIANNWPDKENESQLIGLGYKYGGGRWGDWSASQRNWINTTRNPCGYVVSQSDHWAFAGTGLSNNTTFGSDDRLVGYEADGKPPTGSTFKVLAQSQALTGWNDGAGNLASFGIMGNDSGRYLQNVVFNAGTTDWARILGTPAAASYAVVSKITANVLRTLEDRPD